jgi:hypothetical protein
MVKIIENQYIEEDNGKFQDKVYHPFSAKHKQEQNLNVPARKL